MRLSTSIDATTQAIYDSRPEWRERCGNDFLLVHNPAIVRKDRHPCRLSQTIAIFCTEGEASGTVNMKEYHLKRDGFLIILSNHIAETTYVSSDFRASYIIMSDAFFDGMNIGDSYVFYKAICEQPCLEFDALASEGIQNYIKFCRNLLAYKDTPNQLEVLQLLTKVIFRAMSWSIHGSSVKQERNDRKSSLTREFLSLVEANYGRHRDVAWYADKMNITAKYLTTIVKEKSGKSAIAWIEDYIILDAKTQLATTRSQIQQISDALGFSSQTIFGRYFKRQVGLSPTQYRDSLSTNK